MRLLLSLLLLVSLGLVVAQPPPAFPPLPSHSGDNGLCLLTGLALSDAVLPLMPQFHMNRFNYDCSCLDWSKVGEAAPRLKLYLYDVGSHAQVWFNGQPINTVALNNALTGGGELMSGPLISGDTTPWPVGRNLIQVQINCGYKVCEYQYTIACDKPDEEDRPGEVVGDPQFVGLRGQEFQVHGVAGEVYNIVSDKDLQYNSKFVFLEKGDCPIVDGVRQSGCFSHPGSYLGELGLKTRAGDSIHIVSGPAQTGFASVTVDGHELQLGQTQKLSADLGSVQRTSTHILTVSIGNWEFEFENSDMFINQKVRVKDARSLRAHGLLGQTWRDTTYNNPIKFIQGAVDDYVVRENDIFGDDFVFNQFN